MKTAVALSVVAVGVVAAGVVAALVAPLWAASKTAATPPAKSPLAPVGTYANYAFAKNASSYDPKNVKYAESGGMPASVRKVGNGFVELGCGSSQVVLKMPMGWYSDEDGQNSRLYTPDERSRIIMGFRDIDAKTFAQHKATLLSETRAQMKQMKQKAAIVRAFSLPGGSYAVEVTNVTTGSGAKNGFLQVFTPNPEKPQFPMSLSLTAPMSAYPKYRGLVGLILRDRKIIWAS